MFITPDMQGYWDSFKFCSTQAIRSSLAWSRIKPALQTLTSPWLHLLRQETHLGQILFQAQAIFAYVLRGLLAHVAVVPGLPDDARELALTLRVAFYESKFGAVFLEPGALVPSL